jgi:hypothetical protein
MKRRTETMASLMSWMSSKITKNPRRLNVNHGEKLERLNIRQPSKPISALRNICTLDLCAISLHPGCVAVRLTVWDFLERLKDDTRRFVLTNLQYDERDGIVEH